MSNSTSLTLPKMAIRSIGFHRWMALLIALGVSAATATIVGALIVGDSVRGSLRHLVVDRLGRIEFVVASPRYFSEDAVLRMGKAAEFPKSLDAPVPCILFPRSSCDHNLKGDIYRASSINVLSIDDHFWSLADSKSSDSVQNASSAERTLGDQEVILNQALADELHVSVGDLVTVRIPIEQAVPSDSPLGKRDELTESLPGLRVKKIIPNEGLGRFDLRSSQRPPRNAFLSLRYVQRELRREGQVNALLVSAKNSQLLSHGSDYPRMLEQSKQLIRCMAPSLSDLGLKIEEVKRTFEGGADSQGPKSIYDYYQISSEQLLLSNEQVAAIEKGLENKRYHPVLTYLANVITKVDSDNSSSSEKPFASYSTITAIASHPELPWRGNNVTQPSTDAGTKDIDVAVNSWLAKRLNLAVEDRLNVKFFLPETVGGKEVEKELTAKIVNIVPLTEPSTKYSRRRVAQFSEEPTVFNDPELTPVVPGITDQESMNDWDVPFKLDPNPTREDDDYFESHRLTPKVFLDLETGQDLFGSRFGKVSSIRVAKDQFASIEALESSILPELQGIADRQGLAPIPIRAQQLQASQGTTPFDLLFLSLSFFVIVAALILVSLLFRLGVEQRSEQWGLLMALGWKSNQVRKLLMRESLIIAAMGVVLGMILGIGYAWLMIWALSHWWVGAISVAFLEFYVTPWSLLIGGLIGLLTAYGTISWTSRSLSHMSVLALLRRRWEKWIVSKSPSRWRMIAALLLGLAALGILGSGWGLSGEARAGAFTGGGMLLLVSALLVCHASLLSRKQRTPSSSTGDRAASQKLLSIASFVRSSARRNPLRSSLAIGLIAIASFLVLSMSLFQASPTESAIGGFSLQATSSLAIPRDLSDASQLRQVLGPEVEKLGKTKIFSFRDRPGDDASCNNLYKAAEPRVIGVGRSFSDYISSQPSSKQFPFAAAMKLDATEASSTPFQLLDRTADGSEQNPIPVILDQNTAMWSLHRGAAIGEVFQFEFDNVPIYFKTVGLLRNTVLQGVLLIDEKNFQNRFPKINGYQFFLMDTAGADESTVTAVLERGFGDEGLDVQTNASVLEQLLAVQNTYLRAFQSLGALGLLLGTLGLAVVQARTVEERKGEIALLRALGFTRNRILQVLISENAVLLLVGTAIGISCTFVAILPAWLTGQQLSSFSGPFGMVLIVIVVGLAAGVVAVLSSGRQSLLEALRGK